MHLPDADARRILRTYLGVRVGGDGASAEGVCRQIIDRLAGAGAAVGDVGYGDASILRFSHDPYHPSFKLRCPILGQYLTGVGPGIEAGWGTQSGIPDGDDLTKATLSFWWQGGDAEAGEVWDRINAMLARAGIGYQNPQPRTERTEPIVPGPNGETLADIRAVLKQQCIDYLPHPDEQGRQRWNSRFADQRIAVERDR